MCLNIECHCCCVYTLFVMFISDDNFNVSQERFDRKYILYTQIQGRDSG